tara:strand:+ start:2036 stop:2638 length:603 start_codon:yes stop_codon:yes gene_type:complete
MLILFAATSTLPVVTNSTFVLIPLKSFVEAKFRLAEVMGEEERIDLAKKMAQIVVEAATPLPVAIVCDDEEVAAWAHEKGAEVIWADKSGLNAAVETGVNALASQGVGKVIIAHGDLPKAIQLSHCADFDGITLVPDRHKDGTPVLTVPTNSNFEFSYGLGSYARHVSAAERSGLPWRSIIDVNLNHDVDEPEDLEGIDL